MTQTNNIKIEPFSQRDSEEIQKIYTTDIHNYICVGPRRYVLTATYCAHMDVILNMPLRPTDVFVVSYPRSGTTWTQELVWLLANDLDFEKAKSTSLVQRYPFLEECMFFSPEAKEMIYASTVNNEEDLKFVKSTMIPAYETLASTPSPRFIKSHLPLSLLPSTTLDSAKVVYVARDPRDVAVSVYHFLKSNKAVGMECDFKEFYYKIFSTKLAFYMPLFEHIIEAWDKREHPNLMFIFYEELTKDLQGTARRVASFLGKQYSDDQLQQLCQHLDFSNFQKNSSVELTHLKKLGIFEDEANKNFVRKGKAGGWREYFDEDMTQHVNSWMEQNLKDTDLRFPQDA